MSSTSAITQDALPPNRGISLFGRRRPSEGQNSHARFRLSREGAHLLLVVLFIFSGAVLRDINLLILLAAVMIGLILLQWRFGIATVAQLTVRRRLPDRAAQGTELDCTLSVSNPRRWLAAWLVAVEDKIELTLPKSAGATGSGAALISLVRPRSAGRGQYVLCLRRRGRYRIGPIRLSTRFPMGLGTGWKIIYHYHDLTIHPKLGQLLPACKNIFQNQREGHSRSASHAGVHEAEFYGLRPWAIGDSRRWIHWRTTARLGELSVRQFERLQQRELCVLLELYQAAGDEPQRVLEQCDRAVAFVATLAQKAAAISGDKLAVAIAGKCSFSLPAVQSRVLMDNLMDHLAIAEPAEKIDYAPALQRMTTALLANSNLLVVSTRANQAAAVQETFSHLLGPKASTKLQIRWLDVAAGDLEPYFEWKLIQSSD